MRMTAIVIACVCFVAPVAAAELSNQEEIHAIESMVGQTNEPIAAVSTMNRADGSIALRFPFFLTPEAIIVGDSITGLVYMDRGKRGVVDEVWPLRLHCDEHMQCDGEWYQDRRGTIVPGAGISKHYHDALDVIRNCLERRPPIPPPAAALGQRI